MLPVEIVLLSLFSVGNCFDQYCPIIRELRVEKGLVGNLVCYCIHLLPYANYQMNY